MKYNEFFEQYQEIERKIQIIRGFAEEILGRDYRETDNLSIQGNGILCSYEYNDSCNCHPEYVTNSYTIPAEWIDAIQFDEDNDYNPEELKILLLTHKAKTDEYLRKQRESEETKRKEREEANKASIEASQRKQYEELKKKFEKS